MDDAKVVALIQTLGGGGGGGGGDATWGNIGGNINDQTDLNNALNSKVAKAQGAVNADKSLATDNNGNVALIDWDAVENKLKEFRAVKVGTITNSSTAFPAQRPDGTALKDEDYVVYIGTPPKTVDNITFTKSGEQAFYDEATNSWTLIPNLNNFINTMFPKGTILMTYDKVSPATYIGGQWELIDEGYYPVATIKETIDEETERKLSPELPNITGQFGYKGMVDGAIANTVAGNKGALSPIAMRANNGNNFSTSQSYGTNTNVGIKLDASKVYTDATNYTNHPIYKENGKVQPKSILVYYWRRVDNGTLVYNPVNLSLSANDFNVDPTTGQVTLRNTVYYYVPNRIVTADSNGKTVSSDVDINNIVLKTREVAGLPLSSDISAQQVQDAIKNLIATLTNKTINADNNTISNLQTSNFKADAIAKSTDNVRTYAQSVDTKLTTEKFLQKTLNNLPIPTANTQPANKQYVDQEISGALSSVIEVVGFVSDTEPTGNIPSGFLWYEANALPTTFPINVKTYDSVEEEWSATTTQYTAQDFNLWITRISGIGSSSYYYLGGEWKELNPSSVSVDNITISKTLNETLFVKDNGISKEKLNSNVADDNTLELDSTLGLQVKDNGITYTKLNSNAVNTQIANSNNTIPRTDAVYNELLSDTNSTVESVYEDNKLTLYVDLKNNQNTRKVYKSVDLLNKVEDFSTLADNDKLSYLDISTQELKNVALSAINAYIQGKLNGAISSVLTDNLTANKLLASDANGKITTSSTSITASAGGIKSFSVNKNGLVTGYISKTLGRGLSDSSNVIGHSNSITAGSVGGSLSVPVLSYDAQGHITSASGTTIYPPTTVGSNGQYWKSDGSGQGVWTSPSTSISSSSTDAQIPSAKAVYTAVNAKSSWTYINILGAATGSTLIVADDWTELLFICRISESGNVYNINNTVQKEAFTQGSPTNNTTFIGFTWNSSYYLSVRLSLRGTGTSRYVKVDYAAQNSWNNNGIYVFKR